MVYHHIFLTAFGHAGVLFQKKPFLIERVFLPHMNKRVIEERVREKWPSKAARIAAVSRVCQDLHAYFEGASISVQWDILDLSGLTPLQQTVLKAVAEIPYGEVRSYGQIAAQVGHYRACRFVGTTLARNPFPVLIPCHRVIRADGSPGQFGGGADLKKRMLLLEQASLF